MPGIDGMSNYKNYNVNTEKDANIDLSKLKGENISIWDNKNGNTTYTVDSSKKDIVITDNSGSTAKDQLDIFLAKGETGVKRGNLVSILGDKSQVAKTSIVVGGVEKINYYVEDEDTIGTSFFNLVSPLTGNEKIITKERNNKSYTLLMSEDNKKE